jgi:diaminopimelate epimerase
MSVKFTKLHGNGNDFILIDEYKGDVIPDEKKAAFAKKYCQRRFGIGADGVLYLLRGKGKSDLTMRIFNEDGSEAEMCGNGIRCFAKYALDAGYLKPGKALIDTLAGQLGIEAKAEDGRATIKVGMGRLLFDRKKIPAHGIGDCLNVPLHGYEVSAVNTGVPHAVIFVDDLDSLDLMCIAPPIRYDRIFPKGANVNFVKRDIGFLGVRTYERGVEGETLSCGTGSVAAAAIARKLGYIRDSTIVKTKGGELKISFDGDFAYMEGPAERVFDGEITLDPSQL